MISRLIICLLIWTKVVVEMASSGAKESACVSMFPLHGADEQVKEAPYILQLSTTSYTAESNITVLLRSNDVFGFKGFLCQARQDLDQYITYGILTPNGSVPMTNNCKNEASLTHTNASRKSSISFTWTSPEQNSGNIIIICTVVQQFDIFWTNITSPVISYSATSSTDSSTFSATTGNFTTMTSPTTSDNFTTMKSPTTSGNFTAMTSPTGIVTSLATGEVTNTTLTASPSINSTLSSSSNIPKLTTVEINSGKCLCYVYHQILFYAFYIIKYIFV